jgi:hypothetical protein
MVLAPSVSDPHGGGEGSRAEANQADGHTPHTGVARARRRSGPGVDRTPASGRFRLALSGWGHPKGRAETLTLQSRSRSHEKQRSQENERIRGQGRFTAAGVTVKKVLA